ncbi:ATP-binding protein [Pelagicoccus sp. SDUM812002]|uniref:ATP-binding protein n=1 Tax=Pelagicoccus sp. SDUM812002 TaxID=3041266 RepID=UPI00280F1295|nr:ATP-binding protein [Pelagicoccus sp. SDUM812002]MDQ8186045.1 ATP-binding protein [Pelagicoccus sp. SDUM812002]
MKRLLRQAIHSLLSSSVRKKFLLATILSSLVTLSMFGVVYVLHEKSSFIEKKNEQLKSLSAIVASNSEASLSFDDPITAGEYLASLSSEPDITQAILYGTDGSTFAVYKRSDTVQIPVTSASEETSSSDSHISRSTQIYVEQDFVGTLYIEMDTTSLKASIREAVIIAILIVGIGTSISVLIAILLQKLITRPLFELEELAKSVAEEGNYSRRAIKRFDDEIGSLANSINIMMHVVQERDQSINDHNRNLEKEVAHRTSELRGAMVKAEAASKAKSDFLSTMSHELRTPLNAIVGMSSILASEKIDLELQNYVKIIQSSSDNLLSIINEILDYSKIESGNLELEESRFALSECLEEAIDMVAALHWEKPIDFFITIDPLLPYSVLGDITRLRQVIVNLLSNASKFTKTGYVWLEAKLANRPSDDTAKHISLAVHDTGIGIPKDRQNRLFQTFSQIDSSTTRQFGGSGLGLAISQKLVNAMGGQIVVASEEGEGTTFSFELSLPSPSEKTIASKLAPTATAVQQTISVSVPFSPLQESLSRLFEAWGMRIEKSGQETDFSIGSRLYGFEPRPASAARLNSLTIHHPLKREAKPFGIYSNSPFRLIEARNFIQQSVSEGKRVVVNESQSSKSPRGLPSSTTRILLAEDNKVNQKVFKLIMKREGFAIDIAADGREAVAAMLKAPYDLIFMDLQMPNMDGLEACRVIRSNPDIEQPWIVGFTANVESEAEPAMRSAGMNDFISKPVKDDRVREALRFYESHRAKGASLKSK